MSGAEKMFLSGQALYPVERSNYDASHSFTAQSNISPIISA